jgi:hypothetical protein
MQRKFDTPPNGQLWTTWAVRSRCIHLVQKCGACEFIRFQPTAASVAITNRVLPHLHCACASWLSGERVRAQQNVWWDTRAFVGNRIQLSLLLFCRACACARSRCALCAHCRANTVSFNVLPEEQCCVFRAFRTIGSSIAK